MVMVQDGDIILPLKSCIERVFQRKYLRYVLLHGLHNSKFQQTSVFCILSFTAEPVGDETMYGSLSQENTILDVLSTLTHIPKIIEIGPFLKML